MTCPSGRHLKTNMKWEEKVVTHSIDLAVLQNGIKLPLHSLDVTYCLPYENYVFWTCHNHNLHSKPSSCTT